MILSCSQIDEHKPIANLIYQANRDFYNLFGKNLDTLLDDIANMIQDENTEEHNTYCMTVENEVIGICTFFNSKELKGRQFFGLKHLLKNSNLDSKALSNYSKLIPPIDEDSLYLSRIAIAKPHRNKGYAKILLHYCEVKALEEKYKAITLHVHKNNEQAKNLYKQQSFKILHATHEYNMMIKHL